MTAPTGQVQPRRAARTPPLTGDPGGGYRAHGSGGHLNRVRRGARIGANNERARADKTTGGQDQGRAMSAADSATGRPAAAAQAMIVPLALAQFIASYAATNMNVAISAIARDIGTTVVGMQATITLFTLTMASLMIPGSKLTEIWGRKRCFTIGMVVYGVGALIAALAQGLGLMIFGYSALEGIGSALMIPPIYILVTVAFPDTRSRAKNFGIVSGAAGLGAAAGPRHR